MAKIKLTEEMIEKAVKHVKSGNFAIVVCQYLGICKQSYYNYMNRAERDIAAGRKTIFVDFLDSIKSAEAEAEMRNVTIIQKAAQETWQAAAWYLERKHKSRWSAIHKHEISGKDGGVIQTDINLKLSRLEEGELDTLEALLKKAESDE